jgi:hypothetical protein
VQRRRLFRGGGGVDHRPVICNYSYALPLLVRQSRVVDPGRSSLDGEVYNLNLATAISKA